MRNPSKHIVALQNGDIDDPGDLDNAAADLYEAGRYADPKASLVTGHVSEFDMHPRSFGRESDASYNYVDRQDPRTGVWYRKATEDDTWYALETEG